LFWEDSVHLSRTALVASFFCYLALYLGYNAIKTKTLHCTKRIFTFTLAMNCVFLIAILYILMSVIGDNFNIILVFNSIVAVFLGVTAVLYFGKFGQKKAYYFSELLL
jgi:hypothetical protein